MKIKKRKSFLPKLSAILIFFSITILIAIGSISAYAASSIDFSVDEALFSSVQKDNITKFYYDASGHFGKIISEYEPVEFASISGAAEHRDWMPISEFPEHLKNAFIATEDRNFYSHHGINIKRTLAAMANYFTHSTGSFGGSTITQQVIKNISGDSEKTVKRKVNEIIRAYHLEFSHSKDEILEVYLNIVPMGEGIAGIGLAAEHFFGKKPNELSISEAATLVGIANAPTRYNPYTSYEACIKKRNTVLSSMLECNYISESDFQSAQASAIILKDRSEKNDNIRSWFVETVCEELCEDLISKNNISYSAAKILLLNGGLSIYTTIDPTAQSIVEKHFEDENNLPREISDGLQYAMVVTDSDSADLRAVVGAIGKKSANRLLNHATVPHVPGSTLKPLALYAPLIDSKTITWSTVFDDVPLQFREGADGEIVEFPRNSPEVYDGLTTIANAIKKSKNTIAVQLYNILGDKKIYASLYNDYGFKTLVDKETTSGGSILTDLAVSPLALGQLTKGIPLRRLTEAYTVFPSDGELFEGRSYVLCCDSSGKVLIEKKSSQKSVISKDTARIMNQLLMNVTDSGTASRITLKELIDVAGKTGTSSNSKDKLFIGYTPYYTAGIWCGYSDGKGSVYGSDHLIIWDSVMKDIHSSILSNNEIKSFSTDGLIYAPYCEDSGELYSPWCTADPRGSRLGYGYFMKGSVPSHPCDKHILYMVQDSENEFDADIGEWISLLDISPRSFPKAINVGDEKYILKDAHVNDSDNSTDQISEYSHDLYDRKRTFYKKHYKS